MSNIRKSHSAKFKAQVALAAQANKSMLIVGFILKLKDAGMNIDIRELCHWTNKLVRIYDTIKEDMQYYSSPNALKCLF